MAINGELVARKFQKVKKSLEIISGQKRLDFLVKLIDMAFLLPDEIVKEILEKNIDFLQSLWTEESNLLLFEVSSSQKKVFEKINEYTDKWLHITRKVGSTSAESIALAVKGYVQDASKQYKKAAAWYAMALERCTDLLRPHIQLELSTCYGSEGDYPYALSLLKESISRSENLMEDPALSNKQKLFQVKLNSEGWSRLGTLYESIGDYEGAENAYDQSLDIAERHGLIWEKYKTHSRKVKFYIMTKNLDEAQGNLIEAENLPLGKLRQKVSIYIAHDWARFYRFKAFYDNNAELYNEALKRYKEVLMGLLSEDEAREERLRNLLEGIPDFFGEIVSGIYECLIGKGKHKLAERLKAVSDEYESALTAGGIFKEVDKKAKLDFAENNIVGILEDILLTIPINYWGIKVEYNPLKDEAVVEGKEVTLNKGEFLIFKFLIDLNGDWATSNELFKYWERRACYLSKNDVRVYVGRLKKKLKLDKYLKARKEYPKGWRLLPGRP